MAEEEKEERIINLPTLHDMHGILLQEGSALEEEEEDTEDEEDSDDDLFASIFGALNEKIKEQTKSTPPPASYFSFVVPVAAPDAASAFTAADTSIKSNNNRQEQSLSSSLSLSTVQTYSQQLNFSLYSPSIASSVRGKNYRSFNSNNNTASSITLNTSASCFLFDNTLSSTTPSITLTGQADKTTPAQYTKKQQMTGSTYFYTYSTATKMDIRSPLQPASSSSRFINAFHRFKNSTTTSTHYHRNHLGSVAPAEIVTTIKSPSPSKSSLADRIKHKFQHRKRSKTTTSVIFALKEEKEEATGNKKKSSLSQKPGFSMSRSASLSTITNWTCSKKTTVTSAAIPPLPTTKFANQRNNKMPHSMSVTSFNKSSTRPSSSGTSSCSYEMINSSSLMSPPSSFSLTKSISSHRLYNNKSSTSSNNNHSSSSRNSSSSSRPRHPLRAVNPNDSVRLISLQKQPQQKKKKKRQVQFTKLVSVRETWSKQDYDRGSDPEAVCTRLTPLIAQEIKEELNAYKLHEMQVHKFSRVHTHFFM